MGGFVDLSGQRFERLQVLRRDQSKTNARGAHWVCRCDCGKEWSVDSCALRSGRTKSCGCGILKGEPRGQSKTQEYAIYRGIISRCENPNRKTYAAYGGRGIRIDPKWRKSFSAFLADIGTRPSPKHSVDRIDPDGHYEPGNVRWVCSAEQVNNRRNTRMVTYRNQRMPLTEAVRLAGSVIHYEAAWVRIRQGWDIARALETPRLHASPNSHRAIMDDQLKGAA